MIETSMREPGYGQAGASGSGLVIARVSPAGQARGSVTVKTARTGYPGTGIRSFKAKQKVLDTGPHCRAHLPGEKPGGSAS
ncbi:hypothetical protein [Rhizobium sp. Root483D2]|jgi:hypothetical protein|uniref:hypothetical protein n=1 Tax=Rhizobium sp. Root483D2 TaxID=1736545 RepID=UPI0007156E2F|nr:hypothetical protein [Rhizobium sp. Root483D2]KQY36088.1 hypothetical protein ASD32_19150 [Rhizobium sp. Root483D2]